MRRRRRRRHGDTAAASADAATETTAASATTAGADDHGAERHRGRDHRGDGRQLGDHGGRGAGGNGALEGLKGTTPLVELSQDFKDRLLADQPAADGLQLRRRDLRRDHDHRPRRRAGARTTASPTPSKINGITRDGEKCTDFASCKAIIDAGGDPDYDGISGPLEFAGNGEPLEASYGLLTFGADNRIDDALTEYLPAIGAGRGRRARRIPVVGTRAGDGVLTIGSILPQTGTLAFLGPPEFAAFDLAIKDINDAGGVLGKPVVGIPGDSGDTSTDTANQTVDRLLSQNVDAIIGAASSGVSPDRHRQDHGRRRGAVLAGQHVQDAVDLRRQGPVLPHRPVGHPAGRDPRRGHRR